jgi:ribosome-binding factor A
MRAKGFIYFKFSAINIASASKQPALKPCKVTTFTVPLLRFYDRGLNFKLIMEEGKRQKQVAGVIHEELTTIFTKLSLNIIDGGLVSIASVKITPDLLEARIYLSVFQAKNNSAVLQKIEDRAHEIKRELASRIKHQLRRIPEIKYFLDDTLDHVFKMEELFKKIDEEKKS